MKLLVLFLALWVNTLPADADAAAAQMLAKACRLGDLNTAEVLLSSGVDPNQPDRYGRTPLYYSALFNPNDAATLLLAHEADPNIRASSGTLGSGLPQTPLQIAASMGNLPIASMLVAAGAHVDARTEAGRGEVQLVRYLLQFGPNLAIPDNRGYTPLENAIRMGNADSAVSLLESAPKNQKTPEFLGRILSPAIKKDESVVVEALLRHAALANDALSSGATPLDAAASAGAIEVVRVLLNSGADPNKTGPNGTSPLDDASLRGFDAIVEMLLDHGAEVNQVNTGSGTTALYAAAAFGKRDIVNLLLKRGADPNICGPGRGNPYQTAIENGYSDIAMQIQRHGGSSGCKPEHIPNQ
ncbi:MAG: ankyrin repeat domain-containing protein [Bryobacteraceae bacterium]